MHIGQLSKVKEAWDEPKGEGMCIYELGNLVWKVCLTLIMTNGVANDGFQLERGLQGFIVAQ